MKFMLRLKNIMFLMVIFLMLLLVLSSAIAIYEKHDANMSFENSYDFTSEKYSLVQHKVAQAQTISDNYLRTSHIRFLPTNIYIAFPEEYGMAILKKVGILVLLVVIGTLLWKKLSK